MMNGTVFFPNSTNFGENWRAIFLWAFLSSLVVHTIAGVVAYIQMRRRPWSIYIPVVVILYGAVATTLGSSITSVVIAAVYRTAFSDPVANFEVLCWGVGQTLLILLTSIFHFYPSL